MTDYKEKHTGAGLLLPEVEPIPDSWEAMYFKNTHFLAWMTKVMSGLTKAISGGIAGNNITNVKIDYHLEDGTKEIISFPDVALDFTGDRKVYYADINTETILSLDLPMFDNFVPDEGQFPIVHAIRYEDEIAVPIDKATWIGPRAHRIEVLKADIDHVIGSASQVASAGATMNWDGTKFVDRDNATITIQDYEKIEVVGSDVQTSHIEIDNVTGVEIKSVKGAKFQLGTNNGETNNPPFRIIWGSDTEDCKIDLLMDKTFYDLSRGIYRNLTQDQRRIFANQGKRNWVKINGEWCYKPSEVGNVLQNLSSFENPYLLKFGTLYAYKRAADNSYDSLALFADLAIKDGGLRDGVLMSSRFTEVATPDHLSLNPMLNRFLTDLSTLDSDLHSRSEPSTTGFVLNATFLTGSSKVVFPDGLGSIKEGMRVTGASAYGIPDGTNGTTIIVEISDGAEKSAIMVDIDGDEVEATATGTGSVTIENTGALGGSKAEDQFQSFKMEVPYACAGILSPTGGGHDARSSGSNTRTLPLADNFIDDGINGPPRYGSQTQPKSTAAHSRRQV